MLSNSKQTIGADGKRALSGGLDIDQTGDSLEHRLQINDLELLKQAFDVRIYMRNFSIYFNEYYSIYFF